MISNKKYVVFSIPALFIQIPATGRDKKARVMDTCTTTGCSVLLINHPSMKQTQTILKNAFFSPSCVLPARIIVLFLPILLHILSMVMMTRKNCQTVCCTARKKYTVITTFYRMRTFSSNAAIQRSAISL